MCSRAVALASGAQLQTLLNSNSIFHARLCRQGSPLDPEALRMVAATKARSIIVCADGARCGRGAGGYSYERERRPSGDEH